MSRINIYSRDPVADGRRVLGWFDDATLTESVRESTYWDGNNRRGTMSRLQIGYECLYRTSGGRWVRYYNATNEFNGPEFHEYLTDEQARDWLLADGDDEIAEKWFGRIEEESGPGRPEIGGAVHVRLGEELAKVDAWAAERGVKRAEAVRRLISAGLAAEGGSAG